MPMDINSTAMLLRVNNCFFDRYIFQQGSHRGDLINAWAF